MLKTNECPNCFNILFIKLLNGVYVDYCRKCGTINKKNDT